VPVESLPAVRMTANLNSMIRGQQSIEQAERAILGDDVAHHVLDPEGTLGLDPLQASTLDDALEALLAAERDGWFLALPVPGSLAPLRGPAPFKPRRRRTRPGGRGKQRRPRACPDQSRSRGAMADLSGGAATSAEQSL
jgi:hypothetical protein